METANKIETSYSVHSREKVGEANIPILPAICPVCGKRLTSIVGKFDEAVSVKRKCSRCRFPWTVTDRVSRIDGGVRIDTLEWTLR